MRNTLSVRPSRLALPIAAAVVALLCISSAPAARAHQGERHGEEEASVAAETPATDEATATGEAPALAAGAQAAGPATAAPEAEHEEEEGLRHQMAELHPVAVHFPIALLLSAALAETLLAVTGRSSLRPVTRFAVWVGAAGALIAAPLGWLEAGFAWADDKQLVALHRWTGTAVAVWSPVLVALCERAERSQAGRRPLRAGLAVAALAVAAAGFFGGEIVHGDGSLPW